MAQEGMRYQKSRDRYQESRDKYQESRDIWSDYNARQEFEHELIHRKTTWWLTTQTILFAAYGVTLSNKSTADAIEFRKIVACVGFAAAIVTLFGVLAVIKSKFLSWLEYEKFYRQSTWRLPRPLDKLAWGVDTDNTLRTLVPDVLLPYIFAGAWFFVLVR